MKSQFYLPPSSQRKTVEAALIYHHETNDAEHQQHSYEWTRTHWFLQGVRRLNIYGASGHQRPSPHVIDTGGQRRIRIERVLQIMQTEMGRILSVDIGPAINRPPGIGLDSVRETAIAQAALDNFWARYNDRNFHLALAYMIAAYGTAGIGAFDAGSTSGGIYGVDLSLVPPWELRPLPGCVTGVEQVAGIEWFRWVPLDWLKKNFGEQLSIPRKDADNKMGVVEVPAGSHMQTDWSPNRTATTGIGSVNAYNASGYISDRDDVNVPSMKHVQLREYWGYGDDYSCLRWNVCLGDHLALDVDYTNQKDRDRVGLVGNELPIAPLHVARYLTVGSFWGRGLADRHIGLNRELELLVGDMIQDMRDLTKLRVLSLPTSSGINKNNLKNHLRNKILPWQPDYAAPTIKPEILNPPSAGDVPGKTAALVNSLIDQTAAQGPLFGGEVPGRVDSTGAVDRIIDQNRVPMFPIADSLESAMSGVWKSTLGILRRHLTDEDKLTVNRLDESIIGVTFDRESGTVSLADNPLPSPQTIAISIRNKFPTSKEVIKQDLKEMLQAGVISRIDYKIASIREGLRLPWVSRAEYENYTTAWIENIIMFGDGQTPKETIANPDADNHVLHLAVLTDFMATPLWRLAGPGVRNAFLEHKEYHLQGMGAFPQDMESIDQFGNVGPPGTDAVQIAGMGVPPMPGQTPFPEAVRPA